MGRQWEPGTAGRGAPDLRSVYRPGRRAAAAAEVDTAAPAIRRTFTILGGRRLLPWGRRGGAGAGGSAQSARAGAGGAAAGGRYRGTAVRQDRWVIDRPPERR